MKSPHLINDEQLVEQFETGCLLRELWDHRMHIRMAYLYLRDKPFEIALDKIRSGIQSYNAKHESPDDPPGYHETITQIFARLIKAIMTNENSNLTSEEFCDRHPELFGKDLLKQYYSATQLNDPTARITFLQPDLRSLPEWE